MNKTPLHLLEGEVSWGVNRIHLIYPRTTWRPTHITFAEMTAGGVAWYPKIWRSVEANPQAKKFARDDAWWYKAEWEQAKASYAGRPRALFLLEEHGLNLFNVCTHHDINPVKNSPIPESWHFPQVCKFGGAIPMAIQLAVQEGFDPLYLIGCDMNHRAGNKNHFDPNYGASSGAADGLHIDAATALKRRTANRMGHELALKSSPVPIYNATVGGALEVFPRVDFESLF